MITLWAYNSKHERGIEMHVRLVAQITIGADQTAVFTYLSDLKYHFLWNPHLQSITPQKRLKTGVKYKTTSLMLGVQISGENVATTVDQPNELVLQNDAGTIHYNVTYRLKTEEGKTKVACTTLVSVQNKALMFTQPVLKMLARRELQADLQALKIAVEQKLT